MKKYCEIFIRFFALSLFVIGGGYVILAVAERVFSRLGWTDEGELFEKLPVFQMLPGIIATHTAVYIGSKRAGWRGATVAVAGVALPSVIVFTFVSAAFSEITRLDYTWLRMFFLCMRVFLVYFIISAIVRSWKRSLPDIFSWAVFIFVFVFVYIMKSPVVGVLVLAAAAGLLASGFPRFRNRFMVPGWLAFLCFLKYSLTGFGGGFVLVPMYVEDFVGPAAPFLKMDAGDFSSMIALTQITPGPVGVNAATFFGYSLAGFPGALAASFMLLLPGSVIAFTVLKSLEKFENASFVKGMMRGIRPASMALMVSALVIFLMNLV